MSGAVQILACRKHHHAILCRNKDIPQESSKVVTDKFVIDKTEFVNHKNVCGIFHNCERYSKNRGSACRNIAGRQGNGDRYCRKFGTNKEIIKLGKSSSGGSPVSDVPKITFRKTVLETIAEQNNTMPPNSYCRIDDPDSCKPKATRSETTYVTLMNSKTREEMQAKSDPYLESPILIQPSSKHPQPAAEIDNGPSYMVYLNSPSNSKTPDEMTAKVATDPYLETPILIQSSSMRPLAAEISKGPSYMIYSKSPSNSIISVEDIAKTATDPYLETPILIQSSSMRPQAAEISKGPSYMIYSKSPSDSTISVEEIAKAATGPYLESPIIIQPSSKRPPPAAEFDNRPSYMVYLNSPSNSKTPEEMIAKATTDPYSETPILIQSSSMRPQAAEISKGPTYLVYSSSNEEPIRESDGIRLDFRSVVKDVGVQTSFVSIQGVPCTPATCPGRKRKTPKDLVSKNVQTDEDLLIPVVQIESKVSTSSPSPQKKITIMATSKIIPRKRTPQMEGRHLRRILYFDSKQLSVCNKDVEFCTYRIHRFSKTIDPEKQTGNIKVCPDCQSSRKCSNPVGEDYLACDEIAIEVVSLELYPPTVVQLLKSCFFVYIDYVFLGHVGNETFLAPVSKSVHFDSRKSYCVSMVFNKKERSIIREQVNPTGLLAKDSIMFILVCQAAPEFDILKNWDYAYGYLSMKTVVEQNPKINKNDKFKCEVEMTKIGSTEKIGYLHVIFQGSELIRTIRDENFECMEQTPAYVLQKLRFNNNDIDDTE